ncbi:hypothetical protein [Pseudonocardia parietis]|uniref:Bacteriocin biosynthesis cyclodehydratase domain-containing protein n=1 Tax=Pseudonocardia parietis TaxID=570936 RepID=A0ABS4W3I6_9PSEU|nr:hypothetical protein [Pseudonocardia parietis]MBP2370731.1 hypothetical protein [Pseudonocardia parietis]
MDRDPITGLPPRLALTPHLALVAVGPRAHRIGSGPRARVLDDLSPAAAAALDRLTGGACDVGGLLAGAPPGPDRDALAALLCVLLRAGLLTDPDLAARVRRRRESALVEVRGDSALGVAVVAGLARAGVGAVDPRVGGRAGPGDVAAGLAPSDTGRERAAALRTLLDDAGAAAVPAGRVPPDLVVLAGGPAPGPDGAVEHLVVTLRNGLGVVGPLVLPGRGPCLRCPDRAGEVSTPGSRTAESHVVATTGALAVGQVLAALDGPVRGGDPPVSWAAELEIDPDTATITRHAVPARPGCGCGVVTGSTAACAQPATGWTIEV